MIDPDGSENAITFSNLKTNVGIDAGAFKLTPPPGTQVQNFYNGNQVTLASPDGGVPDAGR